MLFCNSICGIVASKRMSRFQFSIFCAKGDFIESVLSYCSRKTIIPVHKTARGRPTILTPRGVFHGILTDVRPHRELYRRRCDVMGAPIAMVNSIQSSNSSINHILNEDLLELEHDVMARNSWSYAKIGFLMLNATPVAKFSTRFGYLKNGQWTGTIRELIDYKGDIGTNIGVTSARLNAVTYIDVMDNSRPRFIFRQPALSLTSNIFSLPFSSGVWMATGITSFAAGLAFWLSIKLIGRTTDSDAAMGGDGAIDDEMMRDAFLVTMGAISQQGVEVHPRNVSARIILWVIFTTLMALYAAYSANIVVLLQAPSTSINSLEQLAKSKLTLAALDVDYNHFLFKGGMDPVRNEISKRVDPDKGPKAFYDITEGVEKIRKGMFALHGLVEPVYRQIEKTFLEPEKCDLVEIDYLGFSGMYSPASKKSPYVELLRVVYPRLREVGIKAAINNRFETSKPACKDSAAKFSSVGVTELWPVLIFMMYGVALSVGVACMELLVFHANRFISTRTRRRRLIEFNFFEPQQKES
uniref:Putative ionotropic receptor IR75p.1 n=1 Tax=Hedya nubiferana TaxID=572853 RepID=A0A223HCY2_9NEOP|nr:putative ionotropic receptor IR75p.1 [Hedya nubiferana]